MQRRVLITGYLTVLILLIGLQAPLCAMACGASAAPEEAAPAVADMPCHGDTGPATAPEPASQPHAACSCDSATVAAVPAVALATGTLSLPVIATQPFLLTATVASKPHPPRPHLLTVPPTDVLLLKSTLLL